MRTNYWLMMWLLIGLTLLLLGRPAHGQDETPARQERRSGEGPSRTPARRQTEQPAVSASAAMLAG
jgi:hypothetical protein